jgi:hypothetical protein
MKRVIAATIVGAVICMIWGTLSWMVMNWHTQGILKFTDEAVVKKAILENATQPGIYMLPDVLPATDRSGHAAPKAARESAELARQAGPFVFGFIRPGPGGRTMQECLALASIRCALASLIVAGLLAMTARLDFMQRVLFCTLCGAFAGIAVDLPMLIWFESPIRYTLINMADHLMEWFLAGLAISGIVTGKDI